MSEPDDPHVGISSPDMEDDTGDRVAVDEQVDPDERLAKLDQLSQSEDAQGTGSGADPTSSDRQ